jgi:hypothetical protein
MSWGAVSGPGGRREGGMGREPTVPMGESEIATGRVSFGHAEPVLPDKSMTHRTD